MPFMFTSCDNAGTVNVWEWEVNPFTREVTIPKGDKREIEDLLHQPDTQYIFQNPKFDFNALRAARIKPPAWEVTEDVWCASHYKASLGPHGLKEQGIRYLDMPDTDEEEMRLATIDARTYGKAHGWRIADSYDPHWPGTKDNNQWWKLDTWMPAAVAKIKGETSDVTARYGGNDVLRTLALWLMYAEEFDETAWGFYSKRRRLLQVADHMERRGLHFLPRKARNLKIKWTKQKARALQKMQVLSNGKVDAPSKEEKVLKPFLFEDLKLPVVAMGKKTPSASGVVIEEWLDPFMRHNISPIAKQFLNSLIEWRRTTKMMDYLQQYTNTQLGGYLHYTFNVPGTSTTRGACHDPNIQNISKKTDFNLRQCFGPAPGRLWVCIDYSNIEMRIFAHAAGDPDLIAAFESGKSVHLVFFEALHPEESAACKKDGTSPKNVYADTLYQWTKNGNFSLIYGAGRPRCDRTYKKVGAYDQIRGNMPYIDSFMAAQHKLVQQRGYVETLQGYPLQVPVQEPHKAANYVVQGTAGWIISEAMLLCYDYLQTLKKLRNYVGYMVAQVHDELIFDLPDTPFSRRRVVPKIRRLMELPGESVGFPTPVDMKITTKTWAEAG